MWSAVRCTVAYIAQAVMLLMLLVSGLCTVLVLVAVLPLVALYFFVEDCWGDYRWYKYGKEMSKKLAPPASIKET